LISEKWVEKFRIFVASNGNPELSPGQIDNSYLFEGEKLREGLVESLHFEILNEKQWMMLSKL